MTNERKKELVREAHELVKEKGFWDEPRTNEECFALILSEACEALEADRKGRRCDTREYEQGVLDYAKDNMAHRFGIGWPSLAAFERYVKDSVEDELADVCIRCFDLMGARNVIPDGWVPGEDFVPTETPGGITMLVMDVAGMVSRYTGRHRDGVSSYESEFDGNDEELQVILQVIVGRTLNMAHTIGCDLWRHIELKMAYNKTRPRKHGKNY